MKLETILRNLFSDQDYTLIKTDKGLTNQNLLCIHHNDSYMIRLPHEDSKHILKRDSESLCLDIIKDYDFDVEEIYYDKESGIRITRYIDHLYEYEECPYLDKIERTAHLMRKFHNIKKSIGIRFDPIDRLHTYQSRIKKPFFDLQPYEYIINEIQSMNHSEYLCHNDWVSGNILFQESKTYVIDYEYAADNDPLFDVMSFFSENQIVDKELRERFYAIYFKDQNIPYDDLLRWEIFQNLLWCTWAMMMYESRFEEIYRDIAQWKYDALLNQNGRRK